MGPEDATAKSPFALIAKTEIGGYKGMQHSHMNGQKMEGGQSSPFLLRF